VLFTCSSTEDEPQCRSGTTIEILELKKTKNFLANPIEKYDLNICSLAFMQYMGFFYSFGYFLLF